MRGVWLEDGELSVRQLPIPEPPAGEALVRVLQAGICNTDLELVRGYYPFRGVLGHEFVGRVEAGPAALLGARVVGEINCGCGQCEYCERGAVNHCEHRSVLGIVDRHGASADYLSLPVANLHRLPDTLPNDRAVFAEPLAAALRIREQLGLGHADRVLVVGSGKLGQLIARSLALGGVRVAVLGRRAATLERLSACGIPTLIEAELETRSYDVTVECTGNPAGFAIAQRALRPQGRLVLKSTYAGRLQLDIATLVVDELELIGSRCGSFGPALDLLTTGSLETDDLIEARYPLAQARAAFDHARRPGALKVLLDVSAA